MCIEWVLSLRLGTGDKGYEVEVEVESGFREYWD